MPVNLMPFCATQNSSTSVISSTSERLRLGKGHLWRRHSNLLQPRQPLPRDQVR